MIETEEKRLRAIAVAIDTQEYDVEQSLQELTLLCDTAEIDVVAAVVQRLDSPVSGTYVGPGKLEEIGELAETQEADLILVDGELSPTQLRNIEDKTDTSTIDRTMLILDIFAQNAKTKEGAIQVELAQLRYRLPRLAGAGKAMSRLAGGIGTRGPGESKLESDRRHIRRRIEHLQGQVEDMKKRRETASRTRRKNGVRSAALIGYTNVGKSSLLNKLTGSDVLAQNRLFATLDPTARKLDLPDGSTILLVDTVGFVTRLPHHLIEAFDATLKESANADMILRVCDIQSENLRMQLQTTDETLERLQIGEIPVVTVFNKCDSADLDVLPAGVPRRDSVSVSAKTGYHLEELVEIIGEVLRRDYIPVSLLLPFGKTALETLMREHGQIDSIDYTPEGIQIKGSCPPGVYAQVKAFNQQ